jgi:hypothetical protein
MGPRIAISETNRKQLVLFGMRDRTFCPYLAAMNGIPHFSVLIETQRKARGLVTWQDASVCLPVASLCTSFALTLPRAVDTWARRREDTSWASVQLNG